MKSLRLFNLLFKTPLKPYLASQLADPRGWVGRWAAAEMNRSNLRLSRWALERLELAPTDTVLELGFGGAPVFEDLLARAHRVEGLDRSPTMVRAALARFADAVERRKLFLGEGDLMDLPYAPGGFDAAFSVNTVYFWPDAARGAAEFFRVLKPGGRLVLGLRPGELTRRSGLTRHGFRAWEKDELLRLLEGAGFGAVRVDEDKLSGAPVWAAFGRKPQP
jgi:SAM-dependent methyltransferase